VVPNYICTPTHTACPTSLDAQQTLASLRLSQNRKAEAGDIITAVCDQVLYRCVVHYSNSERCVWCTTIVLSYTYLNCAIDTVLLCCGLHCRARGVQIHNWFTYSPVMARSSLCWLFELLNLSPFVSYNLHSHASTVHIHHLLYCLILTTLCTVVASVAADEDQSGGGKANRGGGNERRRRARRVPGYVLNIMLY
jgi:hypothetical protein